MDRAGELFLFTLLAVIWTLRYPFSQDGASHVYNALIARDLVLHKDTILAQYHTLHLVPNWGASVLLMAVSTVLSAAATGKVALSASLILLFYSLKSFAKSLRIDTARHSFVLFFLANSYFVWMGFYNFCLATGLAFFGAGYYLRRMYRLQARDTVLLGALSVVIILTHPVPAVFLSGLLLLLTVHARRFPVAEGGVAPNHRVWLFTTAVTAGGIMLLSSARAGHGSGLFVPSLHAFAQALYYYPLDAFTLVRLPYADFAYFTALQAVILVYVVQRRIREEGAAALMSPLLVGGVALLLACLTINDGVGGGGYTATRISLLSWILLLLYACQGVVADRMVATMRGMSICILAAALMLYIPTLRLADRSMRAFLDAVSAAHIGPGQTVAMVMYPLPVFEEKYGLKRMRVDPLAHVGAWVALQSGSVDLSNYESLAWQFPTIYRPDKVSPTLGSQLNALAEPSSDGHMPELASALSQTATRIDYVLLVGEEGPDWQPAGNRKGIFDVLSQANYELAAEGGSPAFVRVFAKRARR